MPAGSSASQGARGEGKPAAPQVQAMLKFICGIKTIEKKNFRQKKIRNNLTE